MNEPQHQVIRELLGNSKNILLASHIRPDGDCVGSLLGLGLALINARKNVQLVLRDGIPGSLKHLPGSELVTKKTTGPFDLSIVVDCSDLERTGGVLEQAVPDINIDHHITNLNFAKVNFVQPESAATAQLLTQFMETWGLTIDQKVAVNLLTGILSDTIGFRTSNVTSDTLALTAKLMDKGVRLDDLYAKTLGQRSYEAMDLWGKGLSNLHRDGRIIWTTLTLDDRKKASYPGNDDADLINILSGVQDFDISLIFVEQKGGKVKVSWRALPGWNVSNIALQFGGGGHPAASGAEIDGAIGEVIKKVLEVTKAVIKQQNGSNNDSNERVIIPPTEMGSI